MAGFDRNSLMKTLKTAKESEKSGGGLVDQRIWKPEVPEKGKATYRIRVLPMGDSLPWVKLFKHNFKLANGQYFNENCPVTIGKECPICSYSGQFFNTGDEADRKKASKYWRKKNFYTNILVIKDPRNDGANEGKIFIYRFGQKIYDKFDAALFPTEESGEEQLFFIDPKAGYDFNLICKTVGTGQDAFPNYDESTFVRDASPIAKTDKEIEKILSEVYDIETEFVAPTKFKTTEEMEFLLNSKILNISSTDKPKTESKQETKKDTEEKKVVKKEETKKVETSKPEEKKNEVSQEDDDFLKQLEKDLEA